MAYLKRYGEHSACMLQVLAPVLLLSSTAVLAESDFPWTLLQSCSQGRGPFAGSTTGTRSWEVRQSKLQLRQLRRCLRKFLWRPIIHNRRINRGLFTKIPRGPVPCNKPPCSREFGNRRNRPYPFLPEMTAPIRGLIF